MNPLITASPCYVAGCDNRVHYIYCQYDTNYTTWETKKRRKQNCLHFLPPAAAADADAYIFND